jgi:hypothetical protein
MAATWRVFARDCVVTRGMVDAPWLLVVSVADGERITDAA